MITPEEFRDKLLERLEPLWDEAPVWRSIAFSYGWDELLWDCLNDLEGQNFTVMQLKEKLGTGRWYYTHSHDDVCEYKEPKPDHKCIWYHPKCEVERVVSRFEQGTSFLCEECGSYSQPFSDHGWWRNMCSICMKDMEERRKQREQSLD